MKGIILAGGSGNKEIKVCNPWHKKLLKPKLFAFSMSSVIMSSALSKETKRKTKLFVYF